MFLPYDTLKIFYLLLTLPVLILLHISLSYDLQSIAGYAKEDLATAYINDKNNVAVFDSILGIFGGKLFEHQIEIDANLIFPNESLKRQMIDNSTSLEFTMPVLHYNILGFNISASNIEVNATSNKIIDDGNKIRIDFPVMLAKKVNVSNEITNKNFNDVDLSSTYAIYDPKTDKFIFHIPFEVAARYLLNGS